MANFYNKTLEIKSKSQVTFLNTLKKKKKSCGKV